MLKKSLLILSIVFVILILQGLALAQTPQPTYSLALVMDQIEANPQGLLIGNLSSTQLQFYDLSQQQVLSEFDLDPSLFTQRTIDRSYIVGFAFGDQYKDKGLFIQQNGDIFPVRRMGVSQVYFQSANTNQLTLIYEHLGMELFVLSPNQDKAVVGYFPNGEFWRYRGGRKSCFLQLATRECRVPEGLPNFGLIEWLDKDRALIFQFDAVLGRGITYILDANTLTYEMLPFHELWENYSVRPIPTTETLLVYTRDRELTDAQGNAPVNFFIYDLQTESIVDAPIEAWQDVNVTRVSLSPSGRYMRYWTREDIAVVDLQTGQLITRFPQETTGWLRDDTLVFSTRSTTGEYQLQHLDPQTGQIETVLTRSEYIVFYIP
jgi:hypothetical protein